jgi:hypothetical protein
MSVIFPLRQMNPVVLACRGVAHPNDLAGVVDRVCSAELSAQCAQIAHATVLPQKCSDSPLLVPAGTDDLAAIVDSIRLSRFPTERSQIDPGRVRITTRSASRSNSNANQRKNT